VPNRMRTVRSLLLFLSLFAPAFKEVVIISESDTNFDDGQREELEEAGLKLRVTPKLDTELPELDVIYINSIAWVGDSYVKLGERLRLSADSVPSRTAPSFCTRSRGAKSWLRIWIRRSTTGTSHRPVVRCSSAWHC